MVNEQIQFSYSPLVPVGDYYFTVTGYLIQSYGFLQESFDFRVSVRDM
jgi:hypothetical protein